MKKKYNKERKWEEEWKKKKKRSGGVKYKRKKKERIAFALLTSANSYSEIACLILSYYSLMNILPLDTTILSISLKSNHIREYDAKINK